MPKHRLPLVIALSALVVGACGSVGSPSPSSPSRPTISPTPQGLEHPTGATDVVLQLEEGGGFVPIEFLAGQAPLFTLFGDGRVIFQQAISTFPEPGPDGIMRGNAWRTAQLDAAQIEELLTFALGAGGLGAARDNYVSNTIADAPNSIFTVDAGGVKKSVVVNALGMEPSGGPDDAARGAFKKLADRLRDFDRGGSIASDVYTPQSYRAVLFEREDAPPNAVPWPWSALTPSDFKSDVNAAGGLQLAHRTMTPDEVAALKLGDVTGGAQGVVVTAADGKNYSLILRPLLPNESE
jgi:hypothetical protein